MATVKVQINGSSYDLTYNASTGKYEATLTAPSASSYNNNSGHYFPATVTVTDEAGNVTTANDSHSTLGDKLKLYVKEKIKPTVTGVSPASGAMLITANPTISFKILDNTSQASGFSGIDLSSLKLKINGNAVAYSKITAQAVTGGYQCSYTPDTALPEGNNTVTIAVSDNDGNTSDTVTCAFKIDTVPPTLNITSPTNGDYTNKSTVNIVGKTSDATSSPVKVNIKVGSVDQGAVTVGSDGSFSKSVTLSSGANTITVTATDSAGKVSTVTLTVHLKTDAPEILGVTISPNPVDAGKTYTISVQISE